MWNSFLNNLFSTAATAANKNVLAVVGPIDIVRGDGSKEHEVLARMNTGVELSTIDKQLAKRLGIYSSDRVVDRQDSTVPGKRGMLEFVEVRFSLSGVEKTSKWAILDRSQEKFLVEVGKGDLSGTLILV